MRISVIDLGTNTCNLLIVDANRKQDYQILYNNKLAVKLGKGGIDRKEIRPDAMNRGFSAIEKHMATISDFRSDKIYAFATSAIRSARNGEQFVDQARQRFNLEIEIISGDREAELIYYGVKQAVELGESPVLIMDIGGGSNEFIIANQKRIFWKKSYPLGVARLLEKFQPSDPITIEEIEFISNYTEETLADFFEVAGKYAIDTIIGASGSFETMSAMIKGEDSGFESETALDPQMSYIDTGDFEDLYQILINSTLKERKQMKGLEAIRLEMIVLATLQVNIILHKLKIRRFIMSNFSLKEGIIHNLLYNK